jgi:hypothetical protein
MLQIHQNEFRGGILLKAQGRDNMNRIIPGAESILFPSQYLLAKCQRKQSYSTFIDDWLRDDALIPLSHLHDTRFTVHRVIIINEPTLVTYNSVVSPLIYHTYEVEQSNNDLFLNWSGGWHATESQQSASSQDREGKAHPPRSIGMTIIGLTVDRGL